MRELHIGKSVYKIVNISSGRFSSDISGHSHSAESYEIHYCFAGKGELTTDTDSYELKKNTLYITGPNIWHRQIIDKSDPLDEICIYIQKTKTGTDILSAAFNSTHFWKSEANEEINGLFTKLNNIAYSNSLYAKEKQLHITELIITELSFLYSADLVKTDADTPDDKKFVIIENAFIFDYADITLPELSKRLGLSPRQTQRVIKKAYGVTFREKQISSRLEAATIRLQQGKNVNETAFEVGYADAPSFIRAFRKQYGKTPSEIYEAKEK